MKYLYLVCAAWLGQEAFISSAHAAEDGLSVSGSIRTRYETLSGQSRAGLGAHDELFSIRTTLLAEYRKSGFRLGTEIYDSRAYGSHAGSAIGTGEVNTIEPVQAYIGVDVREPFGSGTAVFLQAGRFTLNLGSRRLVAADDYRNTTNGYTGLRADLRAADGSTATLIYTMPQVRRPDDLASILDNEPGLDRESGALRLWGGLFSKPGVFNRTLAEIGYFGLAERDTATRATRNRHLHSFSARILKELSAGRFDHEIEVVHQIGRVRASAAASAASLDVSASFLHADIGYTFPGPLKARLSAEYDYASGDSPGGGYGRFDTLFGMRRADLAPAGIYAQIGRANISTPGLRFEIAPTSRFDGFMVYRAMWLAEKTDAFATTGVRDPSGRSGDFAGHQIEGRARYWLIPKRLRAEANAAWLIKGAFLKNAPNAPQTGNTRYVSMALLASF